MIKTIIKPAKTPIIKIIGSNVFIFYTPLIRPLNFAFKGGVKRDPAYNYYTLLFNLKRII